MRLNEIENGKLRVESWRKCKLEDIIQFNPKEIIKKGEIAKKIAMEKLEPFTREINGYEEVKYTSGTKFRNGDTLLARITPCLENGKTAQVSILEENEVGFGSTEFIVLREKLGIIDKDFIYYLSISPEFRNIAIKSMNGSSGRQRVMNEVLEQSEIALPSLEEQKAIAHILSTLDQKIETNNQINKKLEEMAEAIFKQWFVDFEFPNEDGEPYKSSGGEMVESELGIIPKEWEVSNLEEVIHFNPRESLSKNSTYKFIEMAALSNFSCNIQYWEIKKFNGGSKFRNGDTLLARITPCLENGKTSFVDVLEENEIGFGSTEFIVMREKEVSNKYYIYCLARDKNFRAHAIKSMSGSSGRQRVQIDLLTNYKIARAPEYIYHSFGNVVDSLFKKISNNNKEIDKLKKLRDVLLPKLMSGEIRVPLNN